MADAGEAVFVTGAAGFIGHRVASELARLGHRVIATDVARPRQPAGPGITFYEADIRDIARHAPVIARHCDSIVHCGGISGPMLLGDNPGELLDINIRGTSQLLSLAQSLKLRRFVGLSSVSAYGNTPGAISVDESTPLSASSFYGTSKAASDLILQSYARTLGLSAVALRLGWVYGPGRITDALIQPIVRSAASEPFALSSGADHELQFVHVNDVVAAILDALNARRIVQPAYNVNGAEVVSVGGLREMIGAQLPAIRATIGPGPLADTDVQGRMSLEAAKRDLDWAPRIAFADGLRAYVDWLQKAPY